MSSTKALDFHLTKTWELVSADWKNTEFLEVFYSTLKMSESKQCPCGVCKT